MPFVVRQNTCSLVAACEGYQHHCSGSDNCECILYGTGMNAAMPGLVGYRFSAGNVEDGNSDITKIGVVSSGQTCKVKNRPGALKPAFPGTVAQAALSPVCARGKAHGIKCQTPVLLSYTYSPTH